MRRYKYLLPTNIGKEQMLNIDRNGEVVFSRKLGDTGGTVEGARMCWNAQARSKALRFPKMDNMALRDVFTPAHPSPTNLELSLATLQHLTVPRGEWRVLPLTLIIL